MAWDVVEADPGSGGEPFAMDRFTESGINKTMPYGALAFGVEDGPYTRVTTTDRYPVSAAQNGTWNITNISGTISLPTNAATSALQTTGNTSLASIDGKITACNTGAVVVSSSVLPSGASTAAKQDTGNTSLATIAGAVSGTEMQVDVLTMPAVSITGTVTVDTELPAAAALGDNVANPAVPAVGAFLMLYDGSTWDRGPGTAADGLLVNLGANNDVTVTGSVTANAGTNLNTSALALEAGGNLAAIAASASVLDDWDESDRAKVNMIVGQAGVAAGSGVVGATTIRVTLATDVALPTGSNVIGAVTQSGTWNVGTVTTITNPVAVTDNGGTLSIDDGGSSITVDGTISVSGAVDTELTTADLDTGAGTDTRAVVGLVLAASGGGLLVGAANPMPISDNSGSITVDNAGTFAVQAAQTGTWTVTGAGGTFPVTDSGGSLTVDAPVGTPVFVRLSDGASAISTLPVSLASVPSHAVTNAGTFAVQETKPGTATLTNPATSTTSATLIASNASRKGAVIFNDSTATLYVKFGATASATSFTYKVAPGQHAELPFPAYTGIIDGVLSSGTGTARCTELT